MMKSNIFDVLAFSGTLLLCPLLACSRGTASTSPAYDSAVSVNESGAAEQAGGVGGDNRASTVSEGAAGGSGKSATSAEGASADLALDGNEPSAMGEATQTVPLEPSPRSRVSLNEDWRFEKGDPAGAADLGYANARAWVLPTSNEFLVDPAQRRTAPEANLGGNVAYVTPDFDDSSWLDVTLPHDYAIEGPYTNAISSSMGRLPSIGVAWYRKQLSVAASEVGKSFFIDIDGAMSHSMVWVNGQFAGGWPSGYTSYRVDVSSLMEPGQDNTIAIRVDNPTPEDAGWQSGSSRWYPGAGLYRNVWLVTAEPVHVARWGTQLTTPNVSETLAAVQLAVTVENDSTQAVTATVATDVYELDRQGVRVGGVISSLAAETLTIAPGQSATANTTGSIEIPKLWGPPPTQTPNRYVAVTSILRDGVLLDQYETTFGVRTLDFDSNQGLLINGEHVKLNGVCNHHDLGPLGAAFNYRARERQLQLLAEMGSNAIRTAHNPFEPEFFELADRLGFLIVNEAFDVWEAPKANFDYNLLFADWHEQDLRSLIGCGLASDHARAGSSVTWDT